MPLPVDNFLLTFIIFNFMIPTVIVMRKKVIIGTVLLLIGVVIMAYGVNNDAGVVEEKTDSMSAQEAYEFLLKEEYNKKDPAPLIDPVIILGVAVSLVGVVFLVKSKDEDFLPGI